MYARCIKRLLDIMFSILFMLLFFWLYLLLIAGIKLDSSGPVFFKQKRVGKDKRYFYIHKFRTMRIDTPQDVPTHMFANAEGYITRMGKFLRKFSLDELPQIWDILIGNMSVIGPRPALWNQKDLIEERDKYKVNQIKPGLTGWAQINGRDELEIRDKARLDGEYTKALLNGSGFWMDIRCFIGTIGAVLRHEGVIEGGTGSMKK